MAKIKKVNQCKIKSLKNEIELGFERHLIRKNSLFTDFIQNNRRVFYASLDNNNVLGAISLYSDGFKNTKWELEKLYIAQYPEEIIKKLINYTVNRYGGAGAERFVAHIPQKYNMLIELLKKECHFRSCADIDVHKKIVKDFSELFPNLEMQDFKKADTVPLLELHNCCLFPQFKQSLSTDKSYWDKRIDKAVLKKVLYISNIMEGYFILHNPCHNVFYADILLSDFYQHMYRDLIQYAIASLKQINEDAVLYFVVKKFHQSSKSYSHVMKEFGFDVESSYSTMVRDYWNLIKQKSKEENASSFLFNNIGSPA